MVDSLLIVAAALVIGAVVVLVTYISKLHQAQGEYERAKNSLKILF